jgi:transcriptional regulator with XRE-family HTH domain
MQETAFRKSLSRSVRRIRRERGLTQRTLAQHTGITEKYLSRIELGQVTPSALVAFHLCSALGADLGELISLKPAAERRLVQAVVRLLREQSDEDVECARRILVELFR